MNYLRAKHYVEYNCRVICLIRVAEWNVQYNEYNIICTMYHIIVSADIRDGRKFSTRMSHQNSGVVHRNILRSEDCSSRVSGPIRTQVKTSDTGYIQDLHYTVTNYQTKYRAMNMGYYIG